MPPTERPTHTHRPIHPLTNPPTIYPPTHQFIHRPHPSIHSNTENLTLLAQTHTHLPTLKLDRYIGNTRHRGRLWDNRKHRNHRQMTTIGDQSVPMFHNDVTH